MVKKFEVEYDFATDNSSFSFKKFDDELRKHENQTMATINVEAWLNDMSTIIEMVIGTSTANANKKAEEIIERFLNARVPYWTATWMNHHKGDLVMIFRRSFDGFAEAEKKYYDTINDIDFGYTLM